MCKNKAGVKMCGDVAVNAVLVYRDKLFSVVIVVSSAMNAKKNKPRLIKQTHGTDGKNDKG